MIIHDDIWQDIAVEEEFLSDESKEFLNNFILNENIKEKYSILKSIEEEPDLEKNRIVSPHFEKFKKIFVDWLILYPHSCTELLKMEINVYSPPLSFQSNKILPKVEHDHKNYRQFMLYLSPDDRHAKTSVWREDYVHTLYELEPKKFTAFNFEALPVSQILPKENDLKILTITYK
tara:strand:- start:576 stop:1103 length:528 start_codon:yes stop_codon:yes gene_type:complete